MRKLIPRMVKRARSIGLLASALIATLALTAGLLAGAQGAPQKKFDLDHRYTWDADIIDSDRVHAELGYTGEGVYIAVLDTGLTSNWRDYFPEERIAADLGKGFYEPVVYDPRTGELEAKGKVVETGWIGCSLSTHGTHVTSTILGYNYYAPADAASGFYLDPLFVEGIAPNATIIPVKVLFDYSLGKAGKHNFGTDNAIAAGIDYVTDLAIEGYTPMVISMSLGGPEPSPVIKAAIARAISEGVIVVVAAGNEGESGMDWPGAYQEVISVGAAGWGWEWWHPDGWAIYRLWWLQDATHGFIDIPEATPYQDVYVTDFSGRENQTLVNPYPWAGPQELDVLAPGSWVRGPYPGYPGYNHLPWWSQGKPRGWPWLGNNFYYLGGTSMAAPHVSATAAMMLEKDPSLTQAQIETILESTALPIPPGGMWIVDIFPVPDFYLRTWGGAEATGSGLIQSYDAVDAIP